MESFENIAYIRPDLEQIKASFGKYIRALNTADSASEVRALFFENSAMLDEFDTMYRIAYIRNTGNTLGGYYDEEMKFFNRALPLVDMLKGQATAALLANPYRCELEKELGPLYFKTQDTLRRIADPLVLEDQVQENALVQRYTKAVGTASTEFRGETCNISKLLKYMQSPDRAVRKEAFGAWAGLYNSISEELDDIYDSLVSLRVNMAEKLHFRNYTEMAYSKMKRFDYGPDDVAAFRRQIKEVITPACNEFYIRQAERLGIDKVRFYDESVVFPEGNPAPKGNSNQLVADALKMYKELSPETGAFFSEMVRYNLFDLETRPGKYLGGYCSSLKTFKMHFIFSNFNGTGADVNVLTHEAGHAFAYYTASRLLPCTGVVYPTCEVNEIHSMSMELFAYPWMELFFGDDADRYRYAHLIDALTSIPYMACVDEFQHRVFEQPGMDRMERRRVWRKIELKYMPWRSYDGCEFLEQGGYWMQKQHIFRVPFYYIDYALAQLEAFQFYNRMSDDRKAAWKDYFTLCKLGGSIGYLSLLKAAHLPNPFEPGFVSVAASRALKELGLHA